MLGLMKHEVRMMGIGWRSVATWGAAIGRLENACVRTVTVGLLVIGWTALAMPSRGVSVVERAGARLCRNLLS